MEQEIVFEPDTPMAHRIYRLLTMAAGGSQHLQESQSTLKKQAERLHMTEKQTALSQSALSQGYTIGVLETMTVLIGEQLEQQEG